MSEAKQVRVNRLYDALAALMNMLDEEGEHLSLAGDPDYSGVAGKSGVVEADREAGQWISVVFDGGSDHV